MNVLEYICLDNENKFRSKTVFSPKPIEEIEEVVVDSSIISNVVVESHDIILVPVKCIKNPLIRDDKHWLVLCEIRYPNGSIHKFNTRDPLHNLIAEHSDYEIALSQQFVLFNQEKKPIGWSDKIDLMKNYSSKLDYMQYSQPIIDILIENLIHIGIDISNIQMERMVSRWTISFLSKSATEACDELFLFRYLLQRICSNNNVFVSFHPDPIKSSKIYSRCYLKLSSDKMREENGILEIDRACKKLELKHLEQHKQLCEYNGKHFSYGQNSSRYDAVVYLDSNNSGYLEDKRASGDCDIYMIAEKLIRTIETDYSIDTMSNNLESLKERFNYKNALKTGIIRPVITVKSETATETNKVASLAATSQKSPAPQKKKEKAKASGLSGLARILKLDENSDEEEQEENNENKETKNMSRVEEIIHTIKNMNISHNILQSSSAPKSAASAIKLSQPLGGGLPDMSHIAVPMDPNPGLGMLQSQQHMAMNTLPMHGQQPFNSLQAQPANMGGSIINTPVMPNSLYTLPSQI